MIYVSIFVNSYVFTQKPVEIYLGYLVFAILFPFFIMRYRVPGYFWAIFGLLLISGIVNLYFGYNTAAQFIKVFLGVFLAYLFYYYVVVQFDYNVEYLFQIYLKGCVIVAIIGLIQFVSYMVGFRWGYDFSWLLNKWGTPLGGNFGLRINSIFGEPTYFGACVSAGAFTSVYNLLVKKPYYLTKIQSAIILAAYLLTFSGLAYFALFVGVIVMFINFGIIRYVLIFIPILLGGFYYLYNNVEEFKQRYDSTIDIFTTGQFSIGKTHGSSIILYNNYRVALKNVSNNYIFGAGLGSHPTAFEKHSITKKVEVGGFDLNSMDANSMLLRLISETGLFGTILFLVITFGCFIRRSEDPDIPEYFWIISGGIFTMIFTNLLRQGHYFLNGFPFFIWLYYFNKINYRKFLANKSSSSNVPVAVK